MGYQDLVALAISTSIFLGLAGPRSNSDFVKLAYGNVMGADAPPGGLAAFVGLLDPGSFTQALLTVLAAQSVFNTNSVERVGVANNRVEFLPVGGYDH